MPLRLLVETGPTLDQTLDSLKTGNAYPLAFKEKALGKGYIFVDQLKREMGGMWTLEGRITFNPTSPENMNTEGYLFYNDTGILSAIFPGILLIEIRESKE